MADHSPALRGQPPMVDLDSRLALTAAELAAALGVSERLVRMHQSTIPHFYLGRSIRFPVDAVREWLSGLVEIEDTDSGDIVDVFLNQMNERD